MNLTVSNTNRILRSGNGPTVEYTGQDPIQVNNATHIISLNSAFSAQFAESGVEAKVDELSSCCEQVHSSISSLETQVSSLSSTIEAVSSELPDLEPYATKEWVTDQGYLTQIPDGYLTKAEAEVTYQPIGNYLTSADIENKLDVSALEYTDQGKISAYNGSAFVGEGGGTTYTPGQYISIEDNEISVTGLQPEGDYVTNTELQTVSSDLKDLIPSTDSFLTKASADTLYQPIGDYQPAGDYLTSDDITGFATRDEVSSYLLKDEFTETSSFLQTEISSLSAIVTSASDDYELIEGDYIKLTDNSANHTTEISVTGLPNFSDYASTGDLNALSSLVDSVSSDVISISSTVSSSVTSLSSDIQYVSANCLTAHQSLDDYYKKTETSSKQEISAALASIQPGDAEVQQVVHTYSAEGKWIVASDLDPYLQKSESGVFQPSGNYLSANALEGYATEQWVEDKGYLTAHQDISNLATKDEVSSYLLKSESGNFYPMTGNPSGFLTQHQDLSNYPTRSEISSYATSSQLNTVSSLLSANTITGSRYNTIYISNHNIEGTNSALSREENGVERTIYKTQSAYLYDMGAYSYTAVKVKSPVNTTALYGIYNRGFGSEYKINLANVQANVEVNVPMTYGSDSLLGIYSDSNNAVGVTGYYEVSSIRELAWKSDLSSKQNTITYHYIEV